jgi:hypothetical protein
MILANKIKIKNLERVLNNPKIVNPNKGPKTIIWQPMPSKIRLWDINFPTKLTKIMTITGEKSKPPKARGKVRRPHKRTGSQRSER